MNSSTYTHKKVNGKFPCMDKPLQTIGSMEQQFNHKESTNSHIDLSIIICGMDSQQRRCMWSWVALFSLWVNHKYKNKNRGWGNTVARRRWKLKMKKKKRMIMLKVMVMNNWVTEMQDVMRWQWEDTHETNENNQSSTVETRSSLWSI